MATPLGLSFLRPANRSLGPTRSANAIDAPFARGDVRVSRAMPEPHYSTVTDFARLRGLSTSVPRAQAV
jgi:hypothetical protein